VGCCGCAHGRAGQSRKKQPSGGEVQKARGCCARSTWVRARVRARVRVRVRAGAGVRVRARVRVRVTGEGEGEG
jgi:hypothetical protein